MVLRKKEPDLSFSFFGFIEFSGKGGGFAPAGDIFRVHRLANVVVSVKLKALA